MWNKRSEEIRSWMLEDGFGDVESYWQSLPVTPARCALKIKSDLRLAGLPFFVAVFDHLQPGLESQLASLLEWEGQRCAAGTVIELPAPLAWRTAISGERLALNLLHRASSVATATEKLASRARAKGILLLDTRKTTPGLRALEKYAVRVGGGANHRFTQVDAWMIKDNHKDLMGLRGAVEFFRQQAQPYKSLIVEIHSLDELAEARSYGVTHFLLDNFTHQMLQTACAQKKPGEFFEVSGGIREDTIDQFLVPGVDAVSSGMITQFPAAVDISFKFKAVDA